MTTPPITRRCPFCGAPAKLTSVISEQRYDKLGAYVVCLNCTAKGPTNAFTDEQRGLAAAVFDWNKRATTREWRTDGAAYSWMKRREKFVDKWARACKDTSKQVG